MRILRAVAVLAWIAVPAHAQAPVPKYGEVDKPKSASDMENDRRAEAAYKRSLGNIPVAAPVDPWGTIRSDGGPKSDAKASAVKRPKSSLPGN